MDATWWQDFHQAFRRLARAPWFSGLAILTLALAIGAHTAIFGLIDVLFLRPLPVEDPAELVGVYESRDGTGFHPLSFPDYQDYRDATETFEGLAANYGGAPLMLQVGDEPQDEIIGSVVSGNYFSLLGVEPAIGRFFLPEEDATPGANPVVVVSHDLWQSRFGGRQEVLGAVLKLNDTAFTVVGVAPKGFEGVLTGQPSEVWIPTMMSSVGYRWCDTFDRDCTWMDMIGRLAPGRSLEEARTEMATLSRRVRQAHPSTDGDVERGLSVAPLTGVEPEVRQDRLRLAGLLLAGVTLVLLVAAANLSGLLIARSITHRKEIAVRSALGAPRWRVVSLFLAETVLLSVAGAVAGLLLALWLGRIVALLFPSSVPLELGLSPRVAGYATLLGLVTGLIAGVIPGIEATRPNLVTALKDGVSMGRTRRPRLLGSLVVLQIALSFVLLTATGLMVRSLSTVSELGDVDLDRVLTLRLRPRLVGYEAQRAQPFTREVIERLSRLPGVESVSLTAGLPPPWWYDGSYPVGPPGADLDPDRSPGAWFNVVGPGFFDTYFIPVLRGRDFDERDTPSSVPVVVVNQALAKAVWPGGEAVGQSLVFADDTYQVIGVVRDPPGNWAEEVTPLLFLDYWQNPDNVDGRLAIRTVGDAEQLVPLVREEVRAIDSGVPVVEIETLRQRFERAFGKLHLMGRVVGVAGGLTLFLSAVGLFGVVALAVAQRTHEIAMRRALGGSRSHVVGLVVRDTMILAGIAVVLGLAMSFAANRTVAHFLYGISERDPVSFGVAVLLLAVVAALASWWPARQASRVDPMEALKES